MKKIFKKMILVLLAVMMVFSVAACKGDQGGKALRDDYSRRIRQRGGRYSSDQRDG